MDKRAENANEVTQPLLDSVERLSHGQIAKSSV
jgi:hypothetical protein